MLTPTSKAFCTAVIWLALFLQASAALSIPAPQKLDREEVIHQIHADVEAHHFDDALRKASALAQQDPHDFEARNWVARLNSWKGNYTDAENLYRGVLTDHPGDIEAEVGLAEVLSWQK